MPALRRVPRSPLQLALAFADPLLLRPFLLAVWCALLGVALGGASAEKWRLIAREDAPWPLFLPLALVGLLFAWKFRREAYRARLGIAFALVAFFAAHTSRRLLAPRGDVSWQTGVVARRDSALKAPMVSLVGVVASYPRTSRWNTRFVLQTETLGGKPASGRVAVTMEFDDELSIGDRLSFETQLWPLARPTNPGERARFWTQITDGCWSQNGWGFARNFEGPSGKFALERRVQNVRRAILRRYETLFLGGDNALAKRPFPRQNAALLTAMVWGENGLPSPLPDATREDFRAAGLSHLLVASGTQITFVCAALILLARAFRVRRWALIGWVVPSLLVYALVAGGAPSIARATIFALFVVWCLTCGRDLDALSSWSAALLGLLLFDPALAWSLSLQLTFAAVWGLICLAPLAFRVVRRLSDGVFPQLASMSLGAQWAAIPLTVLHFGTASVAGLCANFIAVPLAGFLVFAGAFGLVLPLGEPLYRVTEFLHWVAQGAANPGGAQVQGASLRTSWAWACYSLLILAALPLAEEWDETRASLGMRLARWRAQLARYHPRAVCLGLGLAALGATVWRAWPTPQTLRVTMLDVGQGESLLIQDPSGRAALIDGGSLDAKGRADIGALVIVPALRELGVSKLDWMFATTPGDEHCNGLARVAREIPVGAFVDGPAASKRRDDDPLDSVGQSGYEEATRELSRRGVRFVVPTRGQTFSLGQTTIRVLGPSRPAKGSQNDNALVLRVEWGERAIVLASNLERAGQERLVRSGAPLRCDVLKVARFGASTSASPLWVRATRPGAAVISCGRYNNLGYPAKKTLGEFAQADVPVFRTDLDGALNVECDAGACRITPTNP